MDLPEGWNEERRRELREIMGDTKVVLEQFIREMKQSEYSRQEVKEVVISGMKGWKSKMKRRVLTGRMYRSAKSTLPTRCRKKLTKKHHGTGREREWKMRKKIQKDGVRKRAGVEEKGREKKKASPRQKSSKIRRV